MPAEKKLKITHFTDPLCFWCYAMEPELRKVRMLLGERLDYRIVMGVLSSDVREFIGSGEDSDLRYSFFRIQMAEHLAKAAETVGMPFSADYMMSCGPEGLVSRPLSTAYCAMKLIDDATAEAYLRRMRECVFAEGRSLEGTDSLVELAREFPIDAQRFKSNLEGGSAAELLQEGVDECQTYFVTAFPSLLLQYGDRRGIMHGYRSFAELKWAVAQITNGEVDMPETQYSVEALEAYMSRFGKAAAREIQIMFSLDKAQLDDAMMDLVGTGRYTTRSCGSSYFAVPR